MFICLVLFRETWIYDFMTYKCIPTATEMLKKTTFHNIADLDGNQNCPSRKTIQLHAFREEGGGVVTLKSACLHILSRLSLVGE